RNLGLSRSYVLAVIAGILVCLILCNSATAISVALGLAIIWFTVEKISVKNSSLFYLAYVTVLLFSVLLPFIDLGGNDVQLLGLDRDASFTGRDKLWEHAIPAILDRPILGYGYHTFFSMDPFSPAWEFWAHFDYLRVASLHNSGMEILASLGIVGFLVYISFCLCAAAVVFNRTLPNKVRYILLLLLSAFTLGSATEFGLFYHNTVATVFLFYVFYCAGIDYSQRADTASVAVPRFRRSVPTSAASSNKSP
nr:O-antigen ligase family protein [Methyloceanibacter sp.]